MKRFTIFMLAGLCLTMLSLTQLNGQVSYLEDFDDPDSWSGGTAGSYTAKYYLNPAEPSNDQFSSDNAVRESANTISGYAWRLRNAGTPYFIYECEETVISFSVSIAHWNPAVALNISIEYSQNSGDSYEQLAILDESWWINQGLGEKEYQQYESGDLYLAPLAGEKILFRIMTDGNERLLLDNFQLLYDDVSAGVEDPQFFSAMTASDSQIDLDFVPNNANDDVVIVFNEDGSFTDPSGVPPSTGSPFAGGTLFYQGIDSPQSQTGLSAGQTVYYKAWSFSDGSYSPGLETQATTTGSSGMPNAWINEIHYDNEGSDVGEFIEIVIEVPGLYDLSSLAVFLYNGSNGEYYASETVNNLLEGSSQNNYTFYTWVYPGIQNGAPEGVAMAMNNVLIDGQFLSYEGTFTGTNGPASGELSTDIGVEEPGTDPAGNSLQLEGAGLTYEHFFWTAPADDTPGSQNNFQEVGNATVWTGQADNDWHNANNWSNGIPGPLSNVVIPDAASAGMNTPAITNGAEAESITMEEGSQLDIAVPGALTVTGTFSNSGILNIHSDEAGTGSLIAYNGITANIEQYLVPGQWHYISSPASSWTSDVFYGMYLMEWDEPTETWSFIEDPGIVLSTGLNSYGVWADEASTVSYPGSLNTGPFVMDISNTPGTPNLGNDPSGFNLAGNPYPSSLDWDVDDGNGWTRTATQVGLSIYFWNGSQYATYVKGGPNPGTNGGTNIIPPHQGFFIKCLSEEGGSIGVDNGARVHASQAFYKDTDSEFEFVRIHLNGNGFSDEMLLNIDENSSPGFDEVFDACKLFGVDEAPQVYSYSSDQVKLSINTLPDFEGNLSLPLGFRAGAPGLYALSLAGVSGLLDKPIYLEDQYDQVMIDLKSGNGHKFLSGAGIFDDRFILHLGTDEIPVQQFSNGFEGPLIYVRDKKIIVSATRPLTGKVAILDLLGREVVSTGFEDRDHIEFDMGNKYGWFIIKLVSGTGMVTRKIFISKQG